MPAFDAILFDFDGVLLDSEPVHYACWVAVLEPAGIHLTWEFYRRNFIGVVAHEMLRTLAAQCDPPRDPDALCDMFPAKRDLYRERMAANPGFNPALNGLLAELHARYKLAVVSSDGTAAIEFQLQAGRLRHHFDTVVGGDQVRRQKPAPEAYLLAAERLGVRTPLVVEDSAPGIAAGRAAGFEVLQVTNQAEVPEFLRRLLCGAGC